MASDTFNNNLKLQSYITLHLNILILICVGIMEILPYESNKYLIAWRILNYVDVKL